jgi:exopolysaccharide production protein ExoZ
MAMKVFHNIQVLRGIAALMVAFHHSTGQIGAIGNRVSDYDVGSLGVDIFFVISGFVIFLTANRTDTNAGAFIWNRIVRIVPLYWVFTLLLAATCVLAPSVLRTTTVTVSTLAQSLLFIPHYNLSFPDKIWPVLVPGWSLNYEMFFYALTAIGTAFLPTRILGYLTVVLLGLIALGLVIQPLSAVGRSCTNLQMLEFLGGAVLAKLNYRGLLTGSRLYIAALPIGALLLILHGAAWQLSLPYPVSQVLACVLIVMGLLAMEIHGWVISSKIARLLGDSSYSIYLTHLFALGIIRIAWVRLAVPTDSTWAITVYFVAALTLSALLGVVVYWTIETPLLHAIKRRPGRGLAYSIRQVG